MGYKWKEGLMDWVAIPENSNEGAFATLAAMEGPTEAFSYSLSGKHRGLFTIDLYGRLALRDDLDFESGSLGRLSPNRKFSVLVRAHTDNGARQEEREFVLSLQNENEFDTDWHDGRYRGGTYNPDGRELNENNNIGSRVAIFRATDADRDATVNYSLSGDDADYFSLDSSGRLYLTSSLDYEDASHGHLYSVVVNADSADASPAISQLYILTVNNVNESNLDDTTATWRTRSKGVRRYENEDGGGLANFAARDSDGGAISYWLSGADAELFSLNSSNRLYVKESFDHESNEDIIKNHRYSVVVNALGLDGGMAMGDGMQALTQSFILTVRNRNEFATEWEVDGNPNGINISEGNGIGLSLADFGAVDGDEVAVTYGLRGRHLQDSYFQIDKETGVLSTRKEFNFESRDHYSVVVRARSEYSNDGSDRLEQTFIVTVGNVNENMSTGWQKNGRPTRRSIYENNTVGASIADFGATDGDATLVTYNLTGGDSNYFSINAESGVLSLRSGLNYEDASHATEYYSVVVHANSTDASDGISSLYVLRVRNAVVDVSWEAGVNGNSGNSSSVVINEQDAIKGLSLANFDLAAGGHIESGGASLAANDGAGGNVSYWLSGSDKSSFDIDRESGVLTLAQDRNYETDRDSHQYTVMVNAGRGHGGRLSELFILSVSNENEFETDWRGGRGYNESGRTINENNSAGTRIASFRATDGDKVDVTYSLQAGGDADYFSLDETGGVARLYAKSSFDHEEASHTDGLYSVAVIANSVDDSLAISQLYVLAIRNRNEFATEWQSDGNPTGNNMSENISVGVSLADFGAVDGDEVAVTYGLRGRYRQDSYFEIDKDTGVLTTNQEFDFENKDHYTVQVRAKSVDGGSSLNQTFVLTVGNIDEFETTWHGGRGYNPLGRNLDENNSIGVKIASFRATDGDDVSLSYFLSGDDATYFSLDERGRLYVRSQLDYEDGHSPFYNIIVNANSIDDSDPISQAYRLTLNNIVNEPIIWQADGNPADGFLLENNSSGITLADFNAVDPEGTDTVTYGFRTRYRDDKYFEIDRDSGVLTTNSIFDHEARNRYTVQVRASSTDSDGGPSINQNFVLTVGNENEFETDWRDGGAFNRSGSAINENNDAGKRIASFRATDRDEVNITYSLATGNDSEYFSIEDRNGDISRLYLKSSLNYEDKALYSVVVLANSVDDSPAISQLYVLTLNNVNESEINDTTAYWHRRSTGTRRYENEDPRELTRFEARDSDGPGISYWLFGDDDFFSIDTVGRLYTTQSFDHESTYGLTDNNRYSLLVLALGTAGDNVGAVGDGLLALTQTYILTIQNRNEFESDWQTNGNPTGGNISENGGIGVSLADFGATDGDDIAVTYGLRGRHRDDSYFQIDKDTGVLSSRREFDFENKEHYTVVVRARSEYSNDGSDRLEQEFILTIGNVNDKTTGWERNGKPTRRTILENNEVGLSLANFDATDGDGALVTYSLSGGDLSYFSINAESGILSLRSGLDYEDINRIGTSADYYNVVVNANSVDGSEGISSVYVLRVQDALVDINWAAGGNPSTATVSENDAVVGLSIADFNIASGGYIEVGGNISYWLSSNNDGAFTIDSDGVLSIRQNRNYETDRSSHEYTVVVNVGQRSRSGSLSELFILSVSNENEFETKWRDGGYYNRDGRTLPENNHEALRIASFRATDGDKVDIIYSLAGTDADYFSIDESNGVGRLYAKSKFDFEDGSHGNKYSVAVIADSADDSVAISQLYVLTVSNRNEFATDWQTGGNPTGGNISENNGIGISLADFGATDGDGVAVTYGLRGRHRDDSYFEIDKDTGVLSAKREFDFENKEHYTVQVRARSVDGSSSINETFILTVANVNDENTGWQRNGTPTRRSIYENNEIGWSLADFGATDGDGAVVSYSLEAGDDTKYFSINADSGILSVTSSFNYESGHAEYYSVVVNANSLDASDGISSLYVLRVRDASVDINWAASGNPSTVTITETGAVVGLSVADFNIASGGHIQSGGISITAVEGDGGNVSYWLSSGRDSSSFRIDRESGVLTLRHDRDYETDRDSHEYTVVVNAGQRNRGGSLSEIFILSVADANDDPVWVRQRQPLDDKYYLPDSDGDPRTIELPEGVIGSSSHAVAGRQVGKFKAVDADSLNNESDNDTSNDVYISYGLSGANESYFSIDSNGRLYLASGLDFENSVHGLIYSVVVHAASTIGGADNALSNLVIISITDRNDPTLWQADGKPSGNIILENNTTGMSVADFGASDGDNYAHNNVTVTYGLRDNYRDDKYFEIDSASGILSVKSIFDFEDSSVAHHNHRYTVVVRARSDDGSPSINQIFVLTIGNADEFETAWQDNGNPSGGTLTENNIVGISLADFNATDGDEDVVITYSLASGSDAVYFNLESGTGILTAKSIFDYEMQSHYSVAVVATSTDGDAISQLYILSVGNENDNPLVWETNGNPSGRELYENNSPHLVLGEFYANDPDGEYIDYSLQAGGDSHYFRIDENGELSIPSSLDFEDPNHGALYSLVVIASNDNDIAISQLYVITLLNENDNDITWAKNPATYGNNGIILENNNPNQVLTVFSAYDGDVGAAISYSLDAGATDSKYFSINAQSGKLSTASVFDHEDSNHDNSYHIRILAHSTDGSVSLSHDFRLTVGNENEFSTTWQGAGHPSGKTIAENNIVGLSLANFYAADGDGVLVTYSLAGMDSHYFNIDSAGTLSTASSYDYETKTYYSVAVNATSTDASYPIGRLFVLTVTDVGNTTSGWNSNNPTGRAIDENTSVGDSGLLSVADFNNNTPSPGVSITYGLSGDAADYFGLGTANGWLFLKSELDYESEHGQSINNRYSIIITANAKDNEEAIAISQVYILTVNDAGLATPDWTNNPPTGGLVTEDNNQSQALVNFNNNGPLSAGIDVTYGLSGDNASFFQIDNSSGLFKTDYIFDYESEYGQSINNRYSVVVVANRTDEGEAISRVYVLTINDISGIGLAPDAPTPDQPVGWNGKILFDGNTETIGGINDGIGNDGLAIIGDELLAMEYDFDGGENITYNLNDADNFADSFVGYSDQGGTIQHHWFFVSDDADDNTGHIVFDADGLDVNLNALNNGGGATMTDDQINLLAGMNFETDGDFAKPDDLDLNLNNNAASLTHDQFLSLIGGSGNIDFV